MAIVRGDRIGESRRLNTVSVEAQTFYAAFIASVPDDFGRFRVSPSHVAFRMYPRREPTRAILGMVGRLMAELEAAGLWQAWAVDGVAFAQMAGWKPTGNLYHRTPEPPGTSHVHTGRCATTAVARADEWNQHEEAERLRLFINEMKRTAREQRPNRGRARVEHPSPPSPPSPPTEEQQQCGQAVEGESEGETQRTPASPPSGLCGPEQFRMGDEPPEGTWIDHDPEDPDQAALVARVLELEQLDAQVDGRPPSREGALNILAAVSGTRAGKCIEGDLRSVGREWLVATLATCETLASETGLTDTSGTAAGG